MLKTMLFTDNTASKNKSWVLLTPAEPVTNAKVSVDSSGNVYAVSQNDGYLVVIKPSGEVQFISQLVGEFIAYNNANDLFYVIPANSVSCYASDYTGSRKDGGAAISCSLGSDEEMSCVAFDSEYTYFGGRIDIKNSSYTGPVLAKRNSSGSTIWKIGFTNGYYNVYVNSITFDNDNVYFNEDTSIYKISKTTGKLVANTAMAGSSNHPGSTPDGGSTRTVYIKKIIMNTTKNLLYAFGDGEIYKNGLIWKRRVVFNDSKPSLDYKYGTSLYTRYINCEDDDVDMEYGGAAIDSKGYIYVCSTLTTTDNAYSIITKFNNYSLIWQRKIENVNIYDIAVDSNNILYFTGRDRYGQQIIGKITENVINSSESTTITFGGITISNSTSGSAYSYLVYTGFSAVEGSDFTVNSVSKSFTADDVDTTLYMYKE